MAAAAPHSQGMLGVQDGCLVSGGKHEALDRAALGVAAGLVPVHDLGEAHEPVPIMAAGNEGPLPAETVAAIHRDRLTTRKERSRHDGSGMIVRISAAPSSGNH